MIALTGGTGFVGRRVARALVAEGMAVRVLSRHPDPAVLPPTVEWATADLTEPSTLAGRLRGVATVIHLAAALPDKRVPVSAADSVNVGGTGALATAARTAGVTHFIHVSSAGVYGDGTGEASHTEDGPVAPTTPYERSKLAAEQALRETLGGSSVRWTVLRPTGLYAADRPATAALFQEVASRRLWLHGPARVLVHPMHVLDFVGAVLLVLRHGGLHGEVLNLGGGRAVEFRELISLIGMRIGHTPLQVSAPAWTAISAAGMAALWGLVGRPPARLRRLARRRINRTVSFEKARRMLGFEPVSLEWGLDQTAAELRQSGQLGHAEAA